MKVLSICANPKPAEESVSKQLSGSFFSRLKELVPDVGITHVDLYQAPPPYYSYDALKAFWFPIFIEGYQPTAEERTAAQYAETQSELLRNTDVLVITTPMWNFSAPAILKAWLDQVLQPERLFHMSAQGIKPLHTVKKVVVLTASGGVYSENDAKDALTAMLRAAFGFIGIEDVAFAWADGQNPMFRTDSSDRRNTAIEAAEDLAAEVAELADP